MTYMIILGLILLLFLAVAIGNTLQKVNFGDDRGISGLAVLSLFIALNLSLALSLGLYLYQVLN